MKLHKLVLQCLVMNMRIRKEINMNKQELKVGQKWDHRERIASYDVLAIEDNDGKDTVQIAVRVTMRNGQKYLALKSLEDFDKYILTPSIREGQVYFCAALNRSYCVQNVDIINNNIKCLIINGDRQRFETTLNIDSFQKLELIFDDDESKSTGEY